MISKSSPVECFVYIILPGKTQSVMAGRFVLTTKPSSPSFGRFIYGRSYLSRNDALAIDPVELKLSDKTYETTRLGGIFGALRDAGPDYWGRCVIEKHVGRTQLSEIDYLLESPDDRVGALAFGLSTKPPAPIKKFNKTIELAKLQRIAELLIQEQLKNVDEETIQIQELMLIATSMGGARPKTVVEDEQGLWIAKFNRPDDRWNNARVEHAMLELARSCGISAAKSKIETVGRKDVLLIKRFDREQVATGYTRARMISGLTVLRAEESPKSRDRWSYVLLSEELRRIVAEPKRDAAELFKRMCFNALISNIDDHPRNHALIAKDMDWKLSPAYDLVPSPVVSQDRRDLALSCGDLDRFANAKNILSQSPRFLLKRDEAKAIVDKMTKQVRATWYKVARSHGVSTKDAELIKGAFVYEGFER